MYDTIIHIILIYSCIFGCFPLKWLNYTIKRNGKSYHYKKSNYFLHILSILYSLLYIGINLAFFIEYFRSKLERFAISKSSDIILAAAGNFCFYWMDLANRVIFITNINKLLIVLNYINEMQSQVQVQQQAQTQTVMQYLTLTNQKSTNCFTCIALINISLAIARTISFCLSYTSLSYVSPYFNTNSDTTIILWCLDEFPVLASGLTSKCLIFWLGYKFINEYKYQIEEFKRIYSNNAKDFNNSKDQSISVTNSVNASAAATSAWTKFKQNFKSFQLHYSIYKDIVGWLIALTIFQSTILLTCQVFQLHGVISSQKYWYVGAHLFGVVEELLNLGLVANLGQCIKEIVKSSQEEIKELLLDNALKETDLDAILFSTNLLKPRTIQSVGTTVGKFLIEYKWKLTAGDLFNVNYGLFPAAAGTSLSLIIFLFQLKLADN